MYINIQHMYVFYICNIHTYVVYKYKYTTNINIQHMYVCYIQHMYVYIQHMYV